MPFNVRLIWPTSPCASRDSPAGMPSVSHAFTHRPPPSLCGLVATRSTHGGHRPALRQKAPPSKVACAGRVRAVVALTPLDVGIFKQFGPAEGVSPPVGAR